MNVITTIRDFGDLLWVDVVAQIDSMTEQVIAFQAQYSKLPKVRSSSTQQALPCCSHPAHGAPRASCPAWQALREWQAFHDCKKTIDDFLEQLPLFQMLAHKAMRPR